MVVTGGYMLKYVVCCSIWGDYMLVTRWLHVGERFKFALQKSVCVKYL